MLLDSARDLEAVLAGKLDVHENDIRKRIFDSLKGNPSVGCFLDDTVRETAGENFPQGRPEDGVIIYDDGPEHDDLVFTPRCTRVIRFPSK